MRVITVFNSFNFRHLTSNWYESSGDAEGVFAAMLKCVIFDMDGTIGETLPLCIAAFKRSLVKLSERFEGLTDGEITATFGPSEEGTVMAFIPERFDEGLNLYLEEYGRLHGSLCPKPFDGIAELFEKIKARGMKLALVTGKGRRSLNITLRVFGMDGCFDAIETGNSTGPSKPAGIMRVLDALGISPDEALYIGDTPSDISASREVSVPIASAAWSNGADAAELEKLGPDMIFSTVKDLEDFLFREAR
jgi:phosphoglycolate phosphatase/pyrophosphatase PpaX